MQAAGGLFFMKLVTCSYHMGTFKHAFLWVLEGSK